MTEKRKLPLLFTPLNIRNITLKNRIAVCPISIFSAIDGFCTNWHLIHLCKFAIGGASLVFTETVAIDPQGRVTDNDLGIWKNDHIDKLKEITNFIKDNGSIPGIQLSHAGMKKSKKIPWSTGQDLSDRNIFSVNDICITEIKELQDKFVIAADRAVKAGFLVINLHAAFGYLIHEFCSPLTNQRIDDYGGSFQNRIRFLIEIVTKIKQLLSEKILFFVRLNAYDWNDNGWSVSDASNTSIILKSLGVDLVDITSGLPTLGNYESPYVLGANASFSEEIKKKSHILTSVTVIVENGIRAENILKSGATDLLMLRKEFLQNPHFPHTAARDLSIDTNIIIFPPQYSHWGI